MKGTIMNSKTKLAIAIAMGCAALAAPTRAWAQDEDKAAAETKPVKVIHEKPSMGPEGVAYAGASVSATPYVLLGWFPAKDFTLAAGLGMTINGNGSATSPLTGLKGDSNAQVGSDVVLAAAYFVVDKFPFAMGPEVVFTGSMAPGTAFDTVVVAPMWALRVAPWSAPIALGTNLGVSIAMVHGAKPTANLTTNGLDVLFAF